MLYQAELRRQARAKADLIESIATGYAGAKSGDASKAMQRYLDVLRRDF